LLSLCSHPSIPDITIVIVPGYTIMNYTSTETVTIARAMIGRKKKEGNHFLSRNKLVQGPEGNEENRYPDPDFNKMKINDAKEPNEAHKNNLKEEILQVINEKFIEMILNMVNQNVQRHSRNSKTTKIENLRKHKNK
jgi:hypothetical protein